MLGMVLGSAKCTFGILFGSDDRMFGIALLPTCRRWVPRINGALTRLVPSNVCHPTLTTSEVGFPATIVQSPANTAQIASTYYRFLHAVVHTGRRHQRYPRGALAPSQHVSTDGGAPLTQVDLVPSSLVPPAVQRNACIIPLQKSPTTAAAAPNHESNTTLEFLIDGRKCLNRPLKGCSFSIRIAGRGWGTRHERRTSEE